MMFMKGRQKRRLTLFSRRRFIQGTTVLGAASLMPRWVRKAWAKTQGPGLSDPAMQPKFMNPVPNALDPGFIYDTGEPARSTRSRSPSASRCR